MPVRLPYCSRSVRSAVGLCLSLWIAGGSAWAQWADDPPGEAGGTILSTRRLFSASGPSRPACVVWCAWAERTYDRLERLLRVRIPDPGAAPLRIRLGMDDSAREVARAQGMPEATLQQELRIRNGEGAPTVDALEGLCWLLMNRYVAIRQRADERQHSPGTLPEWLTTGAARNLHESIREADRRALSDWIDRESVPGPRDLLKLEYVEGSPRPGIRAALSFFFRWASDQIGADRLVRAVAERRARGEFFAAEDLAGLMPGIGGAQALEREWERALRSFAETLFHRRSPVDRAEALQDLLTAEPIALGVSVEGLQAVTDPALIRRRNEPDVRALAKAMVTAMDRLAVGQDAEFVDVARAYRDFFGAFAERGFLGAGPSPSRLRRLWERAEARRRAWRDQTAARERWLDEVERAAQPDPNPPAVSPEQERWLREMEAARDED
jgi:hypothetical protein